MYYKLRNSSTRQDRRIRQIRGISGETGPGDIIRRWTIRLVVSFGLLAPLQVIQRPQNPEVLFLQGVEPLVELLVPWVQDENLECEGRRRHDEVGQGDSACHDHGCFVLSCRAKRVVRGK